MNVIYAAEKPSIAKLLSDYTRQCVRPEDLRVTENPEETGSFFIGWQLERYILSPGGEIVSDTL